MNHYELSSINSYIVQSTNSLRNHNLDAPSNKGEREKDKKKKMRKEENGGGTRISSQAFKHIHMNEKINRKSAVVLRPLMAQSIIPRSSCIRDGSRLVSVLLKETL